MRTNLLYRVEPIIFNDNNFFFKTDLGFRLSTFNVSCTTESKCREKDRFYYSPLRRVTIREKAPTPLPPHIHRARASVNKERERDGRKLRDENGNRARCVVSTKSISLLLLLMLAIQIDGDLMFFLASLWCHDRSFQKFYRKSCRLQCHSNTYRQSRMQARWRLDLKHGHRRLHVYSIVSKIKE